MWFVWGSPACGLELDSGNMTLTLTTLTHSCQALSIWFFRFSQQHPCVKKPPTQAGANQCAPSAHHEAIRRMRDHPPHYKSPFCMCEGADTWGDGHLDSCLKANLLPAGNGHLSWMKSSKEKHALTKLSREATLLYNAELHALCKVLCVICRGLVDIPTPPPMSRNAGRRSECGDVTRHCIMPMTVELM